MRVSLDYGERPREIDIDERSVIVRPPAPGELSMRSVGAFLEAALAAPIGAPALSSLCRPDSRVLIIVSDETRREPRAEMLNAIRRHLDPRAEVRIAIANGTHPPRPLDALALPPWAQPALNHDSRNPSNIVDIGTTSRGTPVRLNRIAMWADLIVATGAIRPHYFAGYGGGVKALFPGLGENAAIRHNHRLKAAPGATAGSVVANPCRSDLEEIPSFLAARTFLLNVVEDPSGAVRGAVAGGLIEAHRAGAALCRPLFAASANRSSLIVVSDSPPVTDSLYQACKMIAAVAPVAGANATIVVAADCCDGIGATGDAKVVNEAIFELGIRPRLPREHRVIVVSEVLARARAALFCEVRSTFDGLLGEPALVIPSSGGSLLLEAKVEVAD